MVTKNKIISMGYLLKNAEGQELDRADSNKPFSYLHGAQQIVPGLEKALEGMKIGEKKDITVPPEEGYGVENPDLRMVLDRSKFPPEMNLSIGMQFSADMGESQRVFTIKNIEGDQVMVDGNHPLAGQTLHFSVDIISIRDATTEEISHGHSHDGGGHH